MIIYKTVNLINRKFYIGQDSQDNPNYMGSGFILTKAIERYGRNNFQKIILEHCINKSELNEREKYWIKKLDATNPNIAYNIATGGQGGNLGPIVARKKSKAMKDFCKSNPDFLSGSNNPNFNHETYHFYNILTEDDIICTKYELANKIESKSSDINAIVNNKRKRHKNWILYVYKDMYTLDFFKTKNVDYSYRKDIDYREKISNSRKGMVRWVKEDDYTVIKISATQPPGFIRYKRKTKVR